MKKKKKETKTASVSVRIDIELKEKLFKHLDKQDKSFSKWFRRVVEKELKK